MRHKVSPLLYQRLREQRLDGQVPQAVLEQLGQTYLHTALRNLRLYHELGLILSALGEREIPAIVLKGGFLAHTVYPDNALRPMADIDLLVRTEDLSTAGKILHELGFAEPVRHGVEPRSSAFHHLPHLIKNGGTVVELHWTIVNPTTRAKQFSCPFELDPQDLFRRAEPVSFGDTSALALSIEDLLLHLCIHMAYEHRLDFGLLPLCDIAETIRHYRRTIDWQELEQRAARWGAQRCTYLSLRLAKDLLNARVPDQILRTMEPDDLRPRFLAWAGDQMLRGQSRSLPPIGNLVRQREEQHLIERIISLLRTVFPSRRYMATLYSVPESSGRLCLCYLLRLERLAQRYAGVGWRMLRREQAITEEIVREKRVGSLMDWFSSG